jgi:hypothetical protein
MRRVITEWGFAISFILIIVFALIWADSHVTIWGRQPLALGTGLYLKSSPGLICLGCEVGEDWKPHAAESGRRAMMATHRYATWLFPGIEYHYRQYTSGQVVWSLEVSVLIPLILLGVVMALCWRLRPRTIKKWG